MRPTIIVLAFVLAACGETTGTGSENELMADQGPCEGLDRAACTADDRCQQAFEDSGFQPMPFASMCLQLVSGPLTTAPCQTLDKAQCRARADCSPLYWQELGSNDAPVGDPYYSMCIAEPQS